MHPHEATTSLEEKLNSNLQYSAEKLTPCCILPIVEGLSKYILTKYTSLKCTLTMG